MRHRRSILLVLATVLVITESLRGATRHMVIIVDTSGSMNTNDRQRFTMQLSQVLSDLVDAGDELSVIRMPRAMFASCNQGISPELVLRLDPSNRAGFKQGLDSLIRFDTGTFFAAPVRTAISLLHSAPNAQRMLLIIADAGGLGECESVLTRELVDLKESGATIAAINLGGSSGAFDRNPAFDFTTAALDAQGLTEAVALVYQRFLGAKKVQTGRVQGEITVDIQPYVDEAFLVVAADGPIGAFQEGARNPGATSIDLNYRGGGITRGLDGVTRGYRIARLERPAPGRWHFRVSAAGGWMLLQDSAVGARSVSSTTLPKGVDVPLEVELFDQRTGQKIADTSKLPGLQVSLDVDGRTVTLHDDGRGGDREAGDGTLTATTRFDKTGETPLNLHLQSDFLDRNLPMSVKVIDASWKVDVQSPKRAEVDKPVDLSVTLQPIGSEGALRPPERVDATAGNDVVSLRPTETRAFTGKWTPHDIGATNIEYKPVGGSPSVSASGTVDVVGRLKFGPPAPVNFGMLKSESEASAQLDLSSADARGNFELRVSSEFRRARSKLEIDLGNGWVPLGGEPAALKLVDRGRRSWPLRLRVGECPDANPAGRRFDIVVTGTNIDGSAVQTNIPVSVEIVPDPWLHCWWPVLALIVGVVAAGIIVHGFWVPWRFPPLLGVVLSPEEDINEGFFHPIREQPGSRSGFYHDARIYISQDYRLASSSRNAVARLRADHKVVKIEAASGSTVWRQNVDGVWEQIPPGESTVRFGDLYRNDGSTLFFELRNA